MSTTLDPEAPVEFKAAPATLNTDDSQGIVEAVVSVTGVEDRVKDIIVPGAYAKTLAERKPRGVWSHKWEEPVAKTLAVEELLPGDSRLPPAIAAKKGGALLVKAQFNLNTNRGREAYEDVKFFGDEQEWSIGYKATKHSRDPKTGIRHIKELALFEYSPVLHGAMPLAKNISVKDAQEQWAEVKSILDRVTVEDPGEGEPEGKDDSSPDTKHGHHNQRDHGKHGHHRHTLARLGLDFRTESRPASSLSSGDVVEAPDATSFFGLAEVTKASVSGRVVSINLNDGRTLELAPDTPILVAVQDKSEALTPSLPDDYDLTDDEALDYMASLPAPALDLLEKGHYEAFDVLLPNLQSKVENVNNPAGKFKARHLIRWFEHGEGAAKIRWGQPGDFMRCVRLAAKHMTLDNAKGFCNLRHQGATGAPPGHAPTEQRGKADLDADLEEKRRHWSEFFHPRDREGQFAESLAANARDIAHDSHRSHLAANLQTERAKILHALDRGEITEAEARRRMNALLHRPDAPSTYSDRLLPPLKGEEAEEFKADLIHLSDDDLLAELVARQAVEVVDDAE